MQATSLRPLISSTRAWTSLKSSCRAFATTSTPVRTTEGRNPPAGNGTGQAGHRYTTNWIRLLDVPKTALHNDVRRAVTRAGVASKFEVYLEYFRFLRNGQAFLKFESQKEMVDALEKIGGRNRLQISAQDVGALPSPPQGETERRGRGFRQRAEDAQKGYTQGTGADAGTMSRGKDVVLYGLPGKIDPYDVLAGLRGFAMRRKAPNPMASVDAEEELDAEELAQAVVKLPQIGRSLTCRLLVRLDNTSEAHRLVRKLHMTYWDPNIWGTKYMCRARVVY